MILCSDGLYGQVTDGELAGVVSSCCPNPRPSGPVALSNERGGPEQHQRHHLCDVRDASAGAPDDSTATG